MTEATLYLENAAIGDNSAVLDNIKLPEKNVAIYQRSVAHLESEIAHCLKRKIELRLQGSIIEITKGVRKALKADKIQADGLLKDIQETLETFKDISKATTFRLFLATVNTNMCRKFHTDINDLRLLCTYSGLGTLWLSNENVNHEAFRENSKQKQAALNENEIQQANSGDVLILKGAIYPHPNTKAIVHRSPTIEEIGATRLLLRIDTNEFLKF